MIRNITICCLLLLLNVAAQAQETTDSVTTDSVSTQTTKQKLMARLNQVQQLLDAKARAKVDSNYIEVPKKPWRVVLRYKESVYDVDYSNSVGSPAAGDGMDWEMRFEPPLSASLGVWAGYRGLGVSVATVCADLISTRLPLPEPSTKAAKFCMERVKLILELP